MKEADIKEKHLAEVLAQYPAGSAEETKKAEALIAAEVKKNFRKIIVLDDDPTGVQTVHGVPVYTGWSAESIEAGFDEPGSLFFILTNSRGMTAAETTAVHTEIGKTIARTAQKKNRDFIIISRSDSTLRGHYPLETQTLRQAIAAETGKRPAGSQDFDGELICPFFIEGGRYTAGNIHYVKTGETLVPTAQSEFARDKTFGYQHSDLTEWVEEKTRGYSALGAFPASSVTAISLEDIRQGGIEKVTAILNGVTGFGKVVLNALDYNDIKIACAALYRALDGGKRFMIRSGAAIPKVLGGVSDRPLLTRAELLGGNEASKRGGLVVIGSHVHKTTRQLECLLTKKNITALEFNTHLVMDDEKFAGEIRRVQRLCDEALEAGRTTVIFTRRQRFDLNTGNKEEELRVAVKIAAAVTSFVSNLKDKPRFIIAKGGITSSEIGIVALKVQKALVLGQVLPGVPVWLTGPESRFPNTPYIIFPGNVGDEDSLKKIVDTLTPEP
ncbi:hypothetical protein AGMMS50268_12230 [Spirochaetia bacterium]|nr:hypothetical protein AGMMS50268_12230 [Spirochaetia bacterium]